MVLPIKVTLPEHANVLAHTVDISVTGARIGGLRQQLQPGKIISLHRGSQRAKFRVVWVRQLDADEIHVGVESMNAHSNFWGVDLSQETDAKQSTETLMELLKAARVGSAQSD
jgi:PilZ domain-containing protein